MVRRRPSSCRCRACRAPMPSTRCRPWWRTTWLRDGLEVDHWALPLDELLAHPDFPGVEVPAREAWGVVGRLPGRGDGPSLLLEGHIDVVPPGDLDAWSRPDPFSGRVDGGLLHGRGACDMKAGLVAARWAVRALRRSGVPLRGDVLLATVCRRGGRWPRHVRPARSGAGGPTPASFPSRPASTWSRRAPARSPSGSGSAAGPTTPRAAPRASAPSRSSGRCCRRCATSRPRATPTSIR